MSRRFNYHSHYGYPWRWAIPAEIAWLIEHLPHSEGSMFEPLARRGYRWRKALERRGYSASERGKP